MAVRARSPGAAPSVRFSAKDRIGGFLDTLWQCTTFGGTHLTHVFYRRKDDAALIVVTKFWLPNRVEPPQEQYEYYAFSDRTKLWTARLTSGTMLLTAPAWDRGDTWLFIGKVSESKQTVPTEMRFTALRGGEFRREFRERRAGAWKVYAGETCRTLRRR
jgi:hypothetical protein